MPRIDDDSLATLLLTSRVVPSDVSPLKASEYWSLTGGRDLASLLGTSLDDLSKELGDELASRVRALLDRGSALAFALEELEQQGIAAIAATDERYPARWRERLGTAAPPHLHAAGPLELLQRPSIGVVGSRDLEPDAVEVAQLAARRSVDRARAVVSGGARGTDAIAMTAALDRGGTVIAILADALVHVARSSDLRQAVLDERLLLVTPYAPKAPFSAGSAMGRNRLIYATADVTLVVASDDNSGGTWTGAEEALRTEAGPVAVWRGPGEGPGNRRLAELGARSVLDIDELFEHGHADEVRDRSSIEQLQLGM
jgi:predicted Rossmann fold nucleotide-binding protein DprA/Smf involved in DNA uptake